MTRIFVLPLVCLLAWSTARADYSFTTIDDPTSGVTSTTINGINNNGDVVGFGTTTGGTNTNFVRAADGTFTVLGAVNSQSGMANGINSSGDVVGVANNLFNGNAPTGFQSSTPSTSLNYLAAPTATTTSSVAFGVNDQGSIVGQYTDSATSNTPAFVDNNGTFTTLNIGTGTTTTFAQGINNNGLVTGFYNVGASGSDGFLYDSLTQQLTTGLAPTVANLAFTQFLGINDNGIAVGYYGATDGSQHGFLYNVNTSVYTFLDDPLAATITQITGINNSGEIAGFYVDSAGIQHGFIANSVPEPGSLTLLGLGVAGLAVWRKRVSR